MEIKQLDASHKDMIIDLFTAERYMGTDSNSNYFVAPEAKFSRVYYDTFCDTYLSGLQNYKAFGCIEQSKVTALISFYESIDDPAWYWTQIRSNSRSAIPYILDAVIKHNESNGRLKFYSLFNNKYAKVFRRFAFSEFNANRYDFVDEFTVCPRTKCIYTMPWQILYSRTLLPVETLVRCSFLKQEHRTQLPVAGNL